MKQLLKILVLVLALSPVSAWGLSCASTTSGNWSAAGTWTSCGGGTPGPGDTATVSLTHTVTGDTDIAVANLTINGTLNMDAYGRTITLLGSTAPLMTRGVVGVFGAATSTVVFSTTTNGLDLLGGVSWTGTRKFYNLRLNPTYSGAGSASATHTFGASFTSVGVEIENEFTINPTKSGIGDFAYIVDLDSVIIGNPVFGLSTTGGATLEFDPNGYNMDLDDFVIQSGATYKPSTTSIHNVAGNLTNSGGTYDDNSTSSGFFLDGTAAQQVSGFTGTNDIYNITVTNTFGANPSDCEITGWVAGIVFSAGLDLTGTLTLSTSGSRLQFNNGSTYNLGMINFNPASTVYLRNSAASGSYNWNVTGTQFAVNNVNVSRANSGSYNTINASSGANTDCGNNVNWIFAPFAFWF